MFKWFGKKKEKLDMDNRIPVELRDKAFEYQQVAALVCNDIDIMWQVVQKDDMSKEDIIAQIRLLVDNKNEMIKNKEVRDRRWHAANLLFSLPRRSVVATKIN